MILHVGRGRASRATPLLLAIVFVAACSSSGNTADRSSSAPNNDTKSGDSGTHRIQWEDDVTFAMLNFEIAGPIPVVKNCANATTGEYFLTVYDADGKAVIATTKVLADSQPKSADALLFVCHFTIDFTVDDSERYRAERTHVFGEFLKDPSVVDYGYTDKAKIEANYWVWSGH